MPDNTWQERTTRIASEQMGRYHQEMMQQQAFMRELYLDEQLQNQQSGYNTDRRLNMRLEEFRTSNWKTNAKLEDWLDYRIEDAIPIEDMSLSQLREAINFLNNNWRCFGQRHKIVSLKRVLKEKLAQSQIALITDAD